MTHEEQKQSVNAKYMKVYEGYKEALSQDPTLTLSAYCRTIGMDTMKVGYWIRANQKSIHALKEEARSFKYSNPPREENGMIVRTHRRGKGENDFGGIEVIYPDGTELRVRACTREALFSFILWNEGRKKRRGAR